MEDLGTRQSIHIGVNGAIRNLGAKGKFIRILKGGLSDFENSDESHEIYIDHLVAPGIEHLDK